MYGLSQNNLCQHAFQTIPNDLLFDASAKQKITTEKNNRKQILDRKRKQLRSKIEITYIIMTLRKGVARMSERQLA